MRLFRQLLNQPAFWLTLPFFLFLVIHRTTQPFDDQDDPYPANPFFSSAEGHIDYPVYNPDCAVFTGNVDSPSYLNYTTTHLDFPIISGNASFPNVKYHFAVNSAPKSYLARMAIRKTWQKTLAENVASGKNNCSGSVRFYVGQTSDRVIARRLHQELKQHTDMVFIEFCDKYETLPLKTYNIMKSVAASLPSSVQFVVKIDDDVLPNFPVFFDCFPTLDLKQTHGIFGWVTVDKVSQDKWDKYRVPVGRWNQTMFPAFTHGPAYVVRTTALPKLLAVARTVPMVNLEDVWFTGIVAEAAKVQRFDVRNFVVAGRTTVDLQHNVHKTNKAGVFYHNVGPVMMRKFWRRVSTCCGCRQHCEVFIPKPVTRKSDKSDLILEDDDKL